MPGVNRTNDLIGPPGSLASPSIPALCYTAAPRRSYHVRGEERMTTSGYRIGVVGVGRMGANMARRLKDRGHVVVAVHDADPRRA